MTTESESSDGTSGTMECAVCRTDVPAGEYCGLCGDHLTEHRDKGAKWLRVRAYSASPGEHLLRPNIVSTLFPHLAPSSRLPFLTGLGLIFAALIATTMLRLPAALITVAALGLPLLFLIYLQESDVYRDVPTSTLVVTAGLGIGLGVGWVLLTGAKMARAYDVGLGMGIAGSRVLRDGLGVPIGGLLLMLVPALLVRLVRPGPRESLDGFAIGALGALMFTAAAQMTRLAPQFAGGMVALWWLSSLYPAIDAHERTKVLDAAGAEGYLHAYERDAGHAYSRVPTGVFVKSIEFLSSTNVAVTGFIWQRLPPPAPSDPREQPQTQLILDGLDLS